MARLAVGSFLAGYREPTLTAHTKDLKAYLGWCQTFNRDLLRVTRGEREMDVRHLEGCGYAAATVARRFGTVATFAAGIIHPISPRLAHHHALGHGQGNLDRHAAHAVAAYLAGLSTG